MSTPKRLNKFIAETGFCSRREADKYIANGEVKVNGIIAELGTQVTDDDEIIIKGKPLRAKPKKVYLALNKPVGIECTTNQKVKDNIIDFVNYPQRIFPIGRLDKNSEGLILLTNDGDIVNEILRSQHEHEKEYLVTVDKKITPDFLNKMSQGVPILDTITKPCKVQKMSSTVFKIILTQGLNRQIRRMCEYFDYQVVALKRIRIMHVHLDIPLGQYRKLNDEEMRLLKVETGF